LSECRRTAEQHQRECEQDDSLGSIDGFSMVSPTSAAIISYLPVVWFFKLEGAGQSYLIA
jgi:hypothetical protein